MRSTVVVTGAASGMGRSVAERFVAEGWRAVAVDVDTAGLDGLAEDLGTDLVASAVDIRDRAAVATALAAARPAPDDGRPLRAVVNAAGIYPTTTLADYTEDTYRRILDINLLGTLNVTAAAVPLIRAAGDGGAADWVFQLGSRPGSYLTGETVVISGGLLLR